MSVVPHWNDGDKFIEDRNGTGEYHQRLARSRWAGTLPKPTFVHGLHAALSTAPPPFNDFGEIRDWPGDNTPTDSRALSGTTHLNPPTASQPETGRSTPGSTVSNTSRGSSSHLEDSRVWESPQYQSDVVRHRNWSARERDRQPEDRYGRDDRRNYQRDRSVSPRRQNFIYVHEDRRRARDTNSERNRNYRERTPPPASRRERTPPPTRRSPPPTRQPSPARRDENPPRIIANPEIWTMPRGADGHPQSAWATAIAAGLQIVDGPQKPSPNPGFVPQEYARVTAVCSKLETPRPDGRLPHRHRGDFQKMGPWWNLHVGTIDQAFNVIGLIAQGSRETYEFWKMVTGNCAAFPREFRSEGESTLLSRQTEIETLYWTTTTGAPRAAREARQPSIMRARIHTPPTIHRVDDAALVHRPDVVVYETAPRKPQPTPTFAPLAFGSTTPASADLSMMFRPITIASPSSSSSHLPGAPLPHVTMLDAAGLDKDKNYLGISGPDANDYSPQLDLRNRPPVDGRPNTRWTIGQTVYVLSKRKTKTWAKGIRTFLMQTPTAECDMPHRDDVLAYSTFCALSPPNLRDQNHRYRIFSQTAMYLFSVKGLFAHFVECGGYPVMNVGMQHYPFITDNITMAEVADWFAEHGIAPASADVAKLEAFARVRRNMQDNCDLDNENWASEPTGPAALQTPASAITKRVEMRRVLYNVPPSLFEGLSSSIHAPPMEDVEETPVAVTSEATVIDVNDLPAPPDSPLSGEED
ncbi:hypothetical protein R3P38DRAFT_2771294 [Favolaschia claudopus]|uniref:Uncharacterized protein n=1 Tax=Favolaschia claudopus TaxID=2862362 RepID=A0AAW0CAX4_9AGAR